MVGLITLVVVLLVLHYLIFICLGFVLYNGCRFIASFGFCYGILLGYVLVGLVDILLLCCCFGCWYCVDLNLRILLSLRGLFWLFVLTLLVCGILVGCDC